MTTRQKLRAAELKIQKIHKEISRLYTQLTKEETIEYITEHDIYWEDIEFSRCKGKPDFTHYTEFVNWLSHNTCTKKWVEWNGQLHRIEAFKRDVFLPTPACTLFIPKRKRPLKRKRP